MPYYWCNKAIKAIVYPYKTTARFRIQINAKEVVEIDAPADSVSSCNPQSLPPNNYQLEFQDLVTGQWYQTPGNVAWWEFGNYYDIRVNYQGRWHTSWYLVVHAPTGQLLTNGVDQAIIPNFQTTPFLSIRRAATQGETQRNLDWRPEISGIRPYGGGQNLLRVDYQLSKDSQIFYSRKNLDFCPLVSVNRCKPGKKLTLIFNAPNDFSRFTPKSHGLFHSTDRNEVPPALQGFLPVDRKFLFLGVATTGYGLSPFTYQLFISPPGCPPPAYKLECLDGELCPEGTCFKCCEGNLVCCYGTGGKVLRKVEKGHGESCDSCE